MFLFKTLATFDEDKHARHPAGSDKGGQFAPKDGDAHDDAPAVGSYLPRDPSKGFYGELRGAASARSRRADEAYKESMAAFKAKFGAREKVIRDFLEGDGGKDFAAAYKKEGGAKAALDKGGFAKKWEAFLEENQRKFLGKYVLDAKGRKL